MHVSESYAYIAHVIVVHIQIFILLDLVGSKHTDRLRD